MNHLSSSVYQKKEGATADLHINVDDFVREDLLANPWVIQILEQVIGARPVLCGVEHSIPHESPVQAENYHPDPTGPTGMKVSVYLYTNASSTETEIWPGSHRLSCGDIFEESGKGWVRRNVFMDRAKSVLPCRLYMPVGAMMIQDMRTWRSGWIAGTLALSEISFYYFPAWFDSPMAFRLPERYREVVDSWGKQGQFNIKYSPDDVQPWTPRDQVNFTEDKEQTRKLFEESILTNQTHRKPPEKLFWNPKSLADLRAEAGASIADSTKLYGEAIILQGRADEEPGCFDEHDDAWPVSGSSTPSTIILPTLCRSPTTSGSRELSTKLTESDPAPRIDSGTKSPDISDRSGVAISSSPETDLPPGSPATPEPQLRRAFAASQLRTTTGPTTPRPRSVQSRSQQSSGRSSSVSPAFLSPRTDNASPRRSGMPIPRSQPFSTRSTSISRPATGLAGTIPPSVASPTGAARPMVPRAVTGTAISYEAERDFAAPGESKSAGSMEKGEYLEFLDFFDLDPVKWPFRVTPTEATDRRMMRLNGTRFNLYDYQLFGAWKALKMYALDGTGFSYVADGAGLGKSFTALGTLLLIQELRIMLEDYEKLQHTERRGGHWRPDDKRSSKCQSEVKSRFRHKCVCENDLAWQIATRTPFGPNLILTSPHLADNFYNEAKKFFLDSTFSLWLEANFKGRGNQLAATARRTLNLRYTKETKEAWSEEAPKMIVIATYDRLRDLQSLFHCSPGSSASPGWLSPGAIVMDEAHDASSFLRDADEMRILTRPEHANGEVDLPMVLMMSGTPIEDDPAGLTELLRLAKTPSWETPEHAMSEILDVKLPELSQQLAAISEKRRQGKDTNPGEVEAYLDQRKAVLQTFMIRRKPTDEFRGQRILAMPELSVTPISCAVPAEYVQTCQDLADRAQQVVERRIAEHLLEHGATLSVESCLRHPSCADVVADLELSSSFPGMIVASLATGAPSPFATGKIVSEMRKARLDAEKTPLWSRMESWTADSPKMDILLGIIGQMNKDETPAPSGYKKKKMVVFGVSEAEAMFIYYRLAKEKRPSIRPMWLSAAVPTDERLKQFARFGTRSFNAPNILVASLAVAGTGVTQLVVASYCVMFSQPFTRKEAEQGFQRIHRLGQELPTHQWLLTTPGNPLSRRTSVRHRGEHLSEHDRAAWQVWELNAPGGEDPQGQTSGQGQQTLADMSFLNTTMLSPATSVSARPASTAARTKSTAAGTAGGPAASQTGRSSRAADSPRGSISRRPSGK